MATGEAGHSAAPVLPPPPAQPDLLAQLAVGAESLHQLRLLAPDVAAGAARPRTRAVVDALLDNHPCSKFPMQSHTHLPTGTR